MNKKPSNTTGGTLKERYHIKEGYNKLLQKIEKARELLKNNAELTNENELVRTKTDREEARKNVRSSIAPDIDTPPFKNWFADSKVVDQNGGLSWKFCSVLDF